MLPPSPTSTFPYRLLSQVGEGAMGQVFLAEDIELGRHVAIKVMKQSYLATLSAADAGDVSRRFIQEARAAAGLSHPGVTVVHRVGTEGSVPYIAMEWLDGRTVEEVLSQSGRLTVEQASRLGLQVLAALDAAHQAGIVHRDIKPGNLMLTKDRRVKVTDFGIARVQDSDINHTQAGLILGTPQYAAPEQLAGGAVDRRADLYSLGAVLYEAVVGRPPFEARSLYELIRLVQGAEVTPPGALVAGVPVVFDEFVLRALAKRPEQRFSSAREMASALQSSLTNRAARISGSPKPPASSGPAVSSRSATLAEVPTTVVLGTSPAEIVAGVVRQWPARVLDRMPTSELIDRLLQAPLHAAPFRGAVEIGTHVLLICDGVLYEAFDVASTARGDLALQQLPDEAVATLHSCPGDLSPRVVMLLASLVLPPEPQLAGLDAALVDVPQLAAKLCDEGFDGAVRFTRGEQLAFVVLSRGVRTLDVFGAGWPEDPSTQRWEGWLARAGATVSVEERRTEFSSFTFARQLRSVALEIVRPKGEDAGSIRSDARETSESLRLSPKEDGDKSPLDSAVRSLYEADPIFGAVRWLLVDTKYQFEQFRRTSRWRAMLDPLDSVSSVILHPDVSLGDGRTVSFDAATAAEDGSFRHVVARAPVGSVAALETFLERVKMLKSSAASGRQVVGAVLFCPNFTEETLEVYLDELRDSRGAGLRAALDLLTHREGFLVTENGGCHVLLVEETDGRRRPLVPQD